MLSVCLSSAFVFEDSRVYEPNIELDNAGVDKSSEPPMPSGRKIR